MRSDPPVFVVAILGAVLVTGLVPATPALGSHPPEGPSSVDGRADPGQAGTDRHGHQAEASGERSLVDAIAWARQASQHQATTLGLEASAFVASPQHETPSEALAELARRHDVSLSDEQRDQLERLDALEEPLATALRDLVEAFLAYQAASEQAYRDADPIRLAALRSQPPSDPAEAPRPGERLVEAGVDLAPALAARNAVLDAVLALDAAVGAMPASHEPGPAVVQPPLIAVDPDGEDNHYQDDVALAVDLGGNDTFHNNAGGSGMADAPCSLLDPALDVVGFDFVGVAEHASAALVDLGDGTDTYGDPADPRVCGANGGGSLGLGLLVDGGGDDAYVANHTAVNGGGELGAGMLVDAGGHDAYQAGVGVDCEDDCDAGSLGVNGGGHLGAGLLVDAGGNDRYDAGVGVECLNGTPLDDSILEECDPGSLGTNGGAAFGVGLLHDAGGHDVYRSGVDVTVDCPPELGTVHNCDVGSVGVNGGGFLGQGLLYDRSGDDTYRSGSHVDLTCGDAVAEAPVTCNVGSSGANGGARSGSGGLVDEAGADTYRAGDNASVTCHPNATCLVGDRGANGGAESGLGLLFDSGGTDTYEDRSTDCDDCSNVPKGVAGAQVDEET